MTENDIIFCVQNSTLNLIISILKKYIIHIRSLKQAFIPNVVVRQIVQRVRIDEKTLRTKHFLSNGKHLKGWVNFQMPCII